MSAYHVLAVTLVMLFACSFVPTIEAACSMEDCPRYSRRQALWKSSQMLGGWRKAIKAIPGGGTMCNPQNMVCLMKKSENMDQMSEEDRQCYQFLLMAEEAKCKWGSALGKRLM